MSDGLVAYSHSPRTNWGSLPELGTQYGRLKEALELALLGNQQAMVGTGVGVSTIFP